MKFVITSLNLQGFDDWTSREKPILEYLHSVSPDVVCFQEVVFLPTVSKNNQAQTLNASLQYPYEFSDVTRLQVGLTHPVYREGLATLSRHRVVKTDSLILKQAQGDRHNRIVQLIDIALSDNSIIKIANVHFSVTDLTDYATPQLKEVLQLLKSRDEKRIIVGDFNLVNLEESSELWKNEYISTSISPYISYPKMNKRIDYALVPNEYSIDSVAVSGDDLSDHRALTVALDIPNFI